MRYRFAGCATLLLAALPLTAVAHEVRPAYLELRQTATDSYDVLWKVPARGEDLRLALYVEFPADTASAAPPRTTMVNDAFTERWSINRVGGLAGQRVRIVGLNATMTDVLVRVESLAGNTQVTRLTPSSSTFVVATSPGAWEVARTYLLLGTEHILFGFDHLLFVLALLILVKETRRLIVTVTAFTVAHSLSLAAATLGFVHVPGKPVEAVISLSIVFVATEIVRGRMGMPGLTARAPWAVAFTFGLLHGLGFAGALSDVGLPQNAIPLALLFFNVGVEVGQLLFIGVALSAIAVVAGAIGKFRGAAAVTRPMSPWTESISAYVIGGMASFWFIERTLSSFA